LPQVIARGFVVTRPYPESGLGSNLASMAGALRLAERLGRDLIVDWRGMVFLEDRSLNYFTEYLAALPEIQGVRVHYAPSEEAGDHLAHEGDSIEIRPTQHEQLVAAPPESLPRFLVLTPYHGLDRIGSGDPTCDFYRLREFYRALRLREEVQQELDRFYDEHLRDSFVVGVNLATGNMPAPDGPLYFGRFDTRLFRDRQVYLRRIRWAVDLAVRRLPRYLRAGRTVFYATDSAWGSELLGQLPRSYTRRTVFPPPGQGRFFSDYAALGYTDSEAAIDQVVDHFLLGCCNALVYNASMFSQYAQVVTHYFNGNVRNIESLYPRWWLKAAAARGRPLATGHRRSR
jgi:hypothetical protein